MDNKTYTAASNAAYVYRDLVQHNKLLLIITLVHIISAVISELLGILIPSLAVGIISGGMTEFAAFAAAAGVLVAASEAVNTTERMQNVYMSDHQRTYIKRVLKKFLTCDYSVLESERGQTMYRQALGAVTSGGDYGTGVCGMIYSTDMLARKAIAFAVYAVMLLRLSPMLFAFVAVMSVIDAAALKYARSYENSIRGEYGGYLKQEAYLIKTSGDAKIGKDVRIYAMSDRFNAIWRRVIDGYRRVLWSAKMRHGLADAVAGVCGAATSVVAYAYLIRLVYSGGITIAALVMYFGVVSYCSQMLRGIMYFINRINLASIQISELRRFIELKSADMGRIEVNAESVDIEFKNVTFKYDGAADNTLENFSLHIKAGEKIALVGVNGAGKTTVVKLLCGFYKPTEGEIFINGVPIGEIKKDSLMSLCSVIFQEAVTLPFTIAENVSMQEAESTDYSRVRRCLERADLMKRINKLAQKLSANMTREFDSGGVIFSGGEQQKLLLARALYKDAPMLIFDEPTAALDPLAESKRMKNSTKYRRIKRRSTFRTGLQAHAFATGLC